MTTINASSGPPPADTPTCTPCGTLMVNAGAVWKCLCCDAVRPRGEFAEFVRVIARGAGMSPSDTPAAIAARVAEQHRDLTALTPAVAAFYAAAKGLPSHVHTRPVCASPSCDCIPKRDGLCNGYYEALRAGDMSRFDGWEDGARKADQAHRQGYEAARAGQPNEPPSAMHKTLKVCWSSGWRAAQKIGE